MLDCTFLELAKPATPGFALSLVPFADLPRHFNFFSLTYDVRSIVFISLPLVFSGYAI